MRSLKFFGARTGGDKALAGAGGRSETLRRQTIANNARILVGAALLAMPPTVYWMVSGLALPFLVASIVLGGGMIALSLAERQRPDAAATAEVATLMVTGLVMTVLEPRLGDSGLATALMGPVLAALIGPYAIRRASWLALLPVVAAGVLAMGAAWPAGLLPGEGILMACFAFGFLVAIAVVAHSAHRINQAYEVHDKAQLSAYRHLIEHVQDAVLRFSGAGEILLASRSSEKLFGCPRYQLTAGSLVERLHVLDRPVYLTAFADANQGGRCRTVEVRMRQDDPRASAGVPHYIWVEIGFSPVCGDEAPAPHHEVIALLRDVTARKDAEVAMAEAREAAEEASQAKSRFLATIGHELRTPLNAVVGFSEMMSSGIGGELSPTHAEYAGLIHQSGRHLLEVVHMLLDMSRIEAGRFDIQAEPLAPAEVVPPCLSMVESLAQARGIRLACAVEQDMPLLTADERVCRQILINLLSNAIKFSHEGGTVTVAVKRQGQAINFSVRDQGIGMAPAALKRIGEPFFQERTGLARQYEGTGLGLSIVKGLVDLHGGTLRAMSEIGSGTTMTVLLPINGPATKAGDTADILTLHRETASAATPSWPDEKRKAQ